MQGRLQQLLVLAICIGVWMLAVLATPWRHANAPARTTILSPQVSGYGISRTVRYAVTVINQHGVPRRDVPIRVAAPLALTSTQRTESLSASRPYRLVTDSLGNRHFLFNLPVLPPYARHRIDIEASLTLAVHPTITGPIDAGRYLGPGPHIEADAAPIRAAANELAGSAVEHTARSAYDLASNHVDYVSYVREDLGALYALTERRGDCTEGASLFTALARANGIPARRMAGFLSRDGRLSGAEYHNWAEFHHADAWWIADPQNRVFARADQRYVALRILDGDEHLAHSTDHAIVAAPPGVALAMD